MAETKKTSQQTETHQTLASKYHSVTKVLKSLGLYFSQGVGLVFDRGPWVGTEQGIVMLKKTLPLFLVY